MQPKSGMTLTEVLIAVAILAIGSVYVLRALSTISYAQVLTENQAASFLFSASKLAEVEAAIVSGKEQKKQTGSFRIEGERGFNWLLEVVPYNEEMKLNALSLDVKWQQGAAAYNFITNLLISSVKPENANRS